MEVKAGGEAYVFRAAGDVELGVGLKRWRAGQAGFWNKGHGPARRLVCYQQLFTEVSFWGVGGGQAIC